MFMDRKIDPELAVRLRGESILLDEGRRFDDGRMNDIVRSLIHDFVTAAKELDAGTQVADSSQYDRIFNRDFPCAVLSDMFDGRLSNGENLGVGQMGNGVHADIPSTEREGTNGAVLTKSSYSQYDWCRRC